MRFLSSFFGSRSAGKASSQKAKSKRGKQLRKRSLFLESLEGRQMMAVDIVFNYDLDSPSGMFSTSTSAGQQARQILEIAANTIEARLNEQLAAIEPTGTNNWIASFQNPLTSQVQSVNNLSIGQNQIMIIVLTGTEVNNQDVVNGATGTALAGAGSSTAFANLVATRGKTDGSIGIWGGGLAFDSDANWNLSLDMADLQFDEYDLLTNAFRGIFQTLGFNAQNDNFTRWIDPSTFSFYGALTIQAMGGNTIPTVAPSINNPFSSTTPTEFDGFWSQDVRFKFSSAFANDMTLMSAPFTLEQDSLGNYVIDPLTGDFVYVTDAFGNPVNAFQGVRVLPTSIDYAGLGDLGWNLAAWPSGLADTTSTAIQVNAPNTLRPSRVNGINGAGDLFGFNFSTGLFKYERAIDVEFFRVDVDLSKSGGQPQLLTLSLRPALQYPGLTASFRVFKMNGSGSIDPVVGLNGEEVFVGSNFSFQFTDVLGSGTYFVGISRPQNIYYDAQDWDAVNPNNPAPFSRSLAVPPTTGLYSLTGFFGAAHNYNPIAQNIIGNVVATTPTDGRILTFGLSGSGQVVATRQPTANDTGFFWTNLPIPGLVAKSFDAEVASGNRLAIASINTQNKLEIRVWANSSTLTFRPPVTLANMPSLVGARNVNVTTLADGRFQVYYVGANNTLYSLTEKAINGGWTNALAVAQGVRAYDIFRNTNGIIDVFYLNTATGALFTRRSTNTSASAWGVNVALGGAGTQVLASASKNGQMNLMLLDASGNLTVRTRPSFGASYTGAVRMNVPPIAHISAGINSNGFLTIFATGKDGNVYAIRQQVANWSTVTVDNLQGAAQTGGVKSTSATVNQDGRLQFFAVSANRSLTTRFQGEPNSRFYS